jgi:hypothetical protein
MYQIKSLTKKSFVKLPEEEILKYKGIYLLINTIPFHESFPDHPYPPDKWLNEVPVLLFNMNLIEYLGSGLKNLAYEDISRIVYKKRLKLGIEGINFEIYPHMKMSVEIKYNTNLSTDFTIGLLPLRTIFQFSVPLISEVYSHNLNSYIIPSKLPSVIEAQVRLI